MRVCVGGGGGRGVVSLLLERVLMYCNVAVFPFVITVYWYLLSGIRQSAGGECTNVTQCSTMYCAAQ